MSILYKYHKLLGLILFLPFIGWISTGVIFLIKPGYKSAYEKLEVKTYPLDQTISISPEPHWQEVRLFKTLLGYHLLVKTEKQWLHLDAQTREEYVLPEIEERKRLIDDAIRGNSERYGVVSIYDQERSVFVTTMGVDITLNWNSLGLSQRGKDTKLIGALYRIHYLQWFGNKPADLMLGIACLAMLFFLVAIGVVMVFPVHRKRI